jgi:DNA-binding CsgD family transcriptional regulator
MQTNSKLNARRYVMFALVAVQAASALAVLLYMVSSFWPVMRDPISWELREALEVGLVLTLLISVVHGVFALRQMQGEIGHVQSKLRVASASFNRLIEDDFAKWQLSPTERDVALFILKGMSNAEIAELTDKKVGTVKAHSNAVFRKSQLANRNQLSSHFLEVLMQEPLVEDANTAVSDKK